MQPPYFLRRAAGSLPRARGEGNKVVALEASDKFAIAAFNLRTLDSDTRFGSY